MAAASAHVDAEPSMHSFSDAGGPAFAAGAGTKQVSLSGYEPQSQASYHSTRPAAAVAAAATFAAPAVGTYAQPASMSSSPMAEGRPEADREALETNPLHGAVAAVPPAPALPPGWQQFMSEQGARVSHARRRLQLRSDTAMVHAGIPYCEHPLACASRTARSRSRMCRRRSQRLHGPEPVGAADGCRDGDGRVISQLPEPRAPTPTQPPCASVWLFMIKTSRNARDGNSLDGPPHSTRVHFVVH